MKLRLYSIYDKKTKIHFPPMYCHNRGDAMRTLERTFSKPGTVQHDYPEDYQIYDVGEFDDATGQVTGQSLDFVCELTDILGKPENESSETQAQG